MAERAAIETAQKDIKDWRRRGLNKMPTRVECLAAPDPTGQRWATLLKGVVTDTTLFVTDTTLFTRDTTTQVPVCTCSRTLI
jgi:hypothetical protein